MRLRSHRGFTLFELLVSIAIVALIIGLTVGGMDDYLELDMRKASNKLASTIRYLYNKSATDALYIRLVMDFEERTYWVEATTDPARVSAELDEPQEKEGEAGKTPAKPGEEEGTERGERPKLKYPKPSFGQVDSFLLKPTKLPGSVFFKDVFVEHRESAIDSGKASIYFFPNGYVEYAIINLRNEDDDYFYSIETNPISGKVSVESEYRTMEGK